MSMVNRTLMLSVIDSVGRSAGAIAIGVKWDNMLPASCDARNDVFREALRNLSIAMQDGCSLEHVLEADQYLSMMPDVKP